MDPAATDPNGFTQLVHDRQARLNRSGHPWNQSGLLSGRIAVIGAGNIGGPAALAAAQAGVGALDIIDFDQVSVPNLSRGLAF